MSQFNQARKEKFDEKSHRHMMKDCTEEEYYNENNKKNIVFSRIVNICILALFCMLYRCPFRYFLMMDCPGCGMTRAVLSVVRLDFKMALIYHSLFWVPIVCAVYYVFREKLYIGKKNEMIAIFVFLFMFLFRWIT